MFSYLIKRIRIFKILFFSFIFILIFIFLFSNFLFLKHNESNTLNSSNNNNNNVALNNKNNFNINNFSKNSNSSHAFDNDKIDINHFFNKVGLAVTPNEPYTDKNYWNNFLVLKSQKDAEHSDYVKCFCFTAKQNNNLVFIIATSFDDSNNLEIQNSTPTVISNVANNSKILSLKAFSHDNFLYVYYVLSVISNNNDSQMNQEKFKICLLKYSINPNADNINFNKVNTVPLVLGTSNYFDQTQTLLAWIVMTPLYIDNNNNKNNSLNDKWIYHNFSIFFFFNQPFLFSDINAESSTSTLYYSGGIDDDIKNIKLQPFNFRIPATSSNNKIIDTDNADEDSSYRINHIYYEKLTPSFFIHSDRVKNNLENSSYLNGYSKIFISLISITKLDNNNIIYFNINNINDDLFQSAKLYDGIPYVDCGIFFSISLINSFMDHNLIFSEDLYYVVNYNFLKNKNFDLHLFNLKFDVNGNIYFILQNNKQNLTTLISCITKCGILPSEEENKNIEDKKIVITLIYFFHNFSFVQDLYELTNPFDDWAQLFLYKKYCDNLNMMLYNSNLNTSSAFFRMFKNFYSSIFIFAISDNYNFVPCIASVEFENSFLLNLIFYINFASSAAKNSYIFQPQSINIIDDLFQVNLYADIVILNIIPYLVTDIHDYNFKTNLFENDMKIANNNTHIFLKIINPNSSMISSDNPILGLFCWKFDYFSNFIQNNDLLFNGMFYPSYNKYLFRFTALGFQGEKNSFNRNASANDNVPYYKKIDDNFFYFQNGGVLILDISDNYKLTSIEDDSNNINNSNEYFANDGAKLFFINSKDNNFNNDELLTDNANDIFGLIAYKNTNFASINDKAVRLEIKFGKFLSNNLFNNSKIKMSSENNEIFFTPQFWDWRNKWLRFPTVVSANIPQLYDTYIENNLTYLPFFNSQKVNLKINPNSYNSWINKLSIYKLNFNQSKKQFNFNPNKIIFTWDGLKNNFNKVNFNLLNDNDIKTNFNSNSSLFLVSMTDLFSRGPYYFLVQVGGVSGAQGLFLRNISWKEQKFLPKFWIVFVTILALLFSIALLHFWYVIYNLHIKNNFVFFYNKGAKLNFNKKKKHLPSKIL